jgi:hypothetical protein
MSGNVKKSNGHKNNGTSKSNAQYGQNVVKIARDIYGLTPRKCCVEKARVCSTTQGSPTGYCEAYDASSTISDCGDSFYPRHANGDYVKNCKPNTQNRKDEKNNAAVSGGGRADARKQKSDKPVTKSKPTTSPSKSKSKPKPKSKQKL